MSLPGQWYNLGTGYYREKKTNTIFLNKLLVFHVRIWHHLLKAVNSPTYVWYCGQRKQTDFHWHNYVHYVKTHIVRWGRENVHHKNDPNSSVRLTKFSHVLVKHFAFLPTLIVHPNYKRLIENPHGSAIERACVSLRRHDAACMFVLACIIFWSATRLRTLLLSLPLFINSDRHFCPLCYFLTLLSSCHLPAFSLSLPLCLSDHSVALCCCQKQSAGGSGKKQAPAGSVTHRWREVDQASCVCMWNGYVLVQWRWSEENIRPTHCG